MRPIAPVLLLLIATAASPAGAQGLTSRAADPADVASLDAIIAAFYDIVSGPAGQPRDWARDSTLYTAGARFVYEVGQGAERRWGTFDHGTYAREVGPFLERGFFEWEIHRVVHRFGNMAQLFSTYEWTSPTETGPSRGRGINAIQLVHDGARWWITHAQWVGESAGNPIPPAYLPPPGP